MTAGFRDRQREQSFRHARLFDADVPWYAETREEECLWANKASLQCGLLQGNETVFLHSLIEEEGHVGAEFSDVNRLPRYPAKEIREDVS